MTEEAKEARRKYKREWAKAHPESVRRSQQKYWQKRAEQEAARQKDMDNQDE